MQPKLKLVWHVTFDEVHCLEHFYVLSGAPELPSWMTLEILRSNYGPTSIIRIPRFKNFQYVSKLNDLRFDSSQCLYGSLPI